MYATIQKWGNSQGLRIPKALLDALGIRENDRVELIPLQDGLRIKKIAAPRHQTLEERLTAFYGERFEALLPDGAEAEIDWGKPAGDEIW